MLASQSTSATSAEKVEEQKSIKDTDEPLWENPYKHALPQKCSQLVKIIWYIYIPVEFSNNIHRLQRVQGGLVVRGEATSETYSAGYAKGLRSYTIWMEATSR